MERYEVMHSEELKTYLEEVKAAEKIILETTDEMKKLEEKRGLALVDRSKVIEKMQPIVTEHFKGKLGEFEIITNVDIKDLATDEINVKIVDEIEVYKDAKRKERQPEVATEEKPAETKETIVPEAE